MADAVEEIASESSVPDAPPCKRAAVQSATESSVPPPPIPRQREPTETPSASESSVPDVATPVRRRAPEAVLGRRAPVPPPRPRKRARVIVLDESSSSSEEFTVVRRKKPRRALQAPEPEPLCVLGGALSNHRQRLDTLKSTYDGFYRHLK